MTYHIFNCSIATLSCIIQIVHISEETEGANTLGSILSFNDLIKCKGNVNCKSKREELGWEGEEREERVEGNGGR